MTYKFNKVLAIVKVQVYAEFHQAKCRALWVILLTKKQTSRKSLRRCWKQYLVATAHS